LTITDIDAEMEDIVRVPHKYGPKNTVEERGYSVVCIVCFGHDESYSIPDLFAQAILALAAFQRQNGFSKTAIEHHDSH